jgi:hypothetical protein
LGMDASSVIEVKNVTWIALGRSYLWIYVSLKPLLY